MAQQSLHAIFFHGDDQEREDYVPPSVAVNNGDIVPLGGATTQVKQIGVCTTPGGIGVGVQGSLAKKGVFKVRKVIGDAITFAQNVEVFWDTVNFKAVTAAGANIIRIGICRDKAAAAGDDFVLVAINEYMVL